MNAAPEPESTAKKPAEIEGFPADAGVFVERVREHDQVARRIRELAPWDLCYELREGVLTLCDAPTHVLAVRRMERIMALAAAAGGIAGRSFLVVSCGSGATAFELARRGAKRVVAIDARANRIEQCRWLQQLRTDWNYPALGFDCGNLEETGVETFDVSVALATDVDPPLPPLLRALARRTKFLTLIERRFAQGPTRQPREFAAAARSAGFSGVMQSLYPNLPADAAKPPADGRLVLFLAHTGPPTTTIPDRW